MSTDTLDDYRRLPDGSIDFEFYTARGRKLRSRAAYGGLRTIGRAMARLWAAPARVTNALVPGVMETATPYRPRRV